MRGNNTLILNRAEINHIVQKYLQDTMFAPPYSANIEVDTVEQADDTFVIKLTSKPQPKEVHP